MTSDSLEYSAQSIADLEYTYGPPGYYCECDPDDYCRCYVYQTIEATKIHFDKVMEILTHRKSTEIPESLKEVGRQVGLDKPESFRFYGSPDYYGEVLDVALYAPETVNKAFQKWHSQNCVDSKDTARAFLYGQGVDSRGKNTLGLVKDFLQKENPGRTSKLVEEAKHVRGGTIPLRDVLIPATHHLERVEAREPKAQRGEPVIQGIVVERDGRYHLVDGYHRHKWATERGKKSGTYLILS